MIKAGQTKKGLPPPPQNAKPFALERKINLKRMKNQSPEIGKSFGAEKYAFMYYSYSTT
jgi:hypothetical protein